MRYDNAERLVFKLAPDILGLRRGRRQQAGRASHLKIIPSDCARRLETECQISGNFKMDPATLDCQNRNL